MFNITAKRVGGMTFIRIGRIQFSYSVQTNERYLEWLEAKVEVVALHALVQEFRL